MVQSTVYLAQLLLQSLIVHKFEVSAVWGLFLPLQFNMKRVSKSLSLGF